MKTQKLNFVKLAFFALLGLGLTLTSCSGEDGHDGINGEMGPQGADGKDGNANVIASDWFKFDWYGGTPTLSEMRILVPEVTQIVENGGMVLMYLKIALGNGNSAVHSLPFDTGNDIVFKYITINAPSQDIVGVFVRLEDPGATGIYLEVQNNPDYSLRYVLVPAIVATAYDLENIGIPETFQEASVLFGLDE